MWTCAAHLISCALVESGGQDEDNHLGSSRARAMQCCAQASCAPRRSVGSRAHQNLFDQVVAESLEIQRSGI